MHQPDLTKYARCEGSNEFPKPFLLNYEYAPPAFRTQQLDKIISVVYKLLPMKHFKKCIHLISQNHEKYSHQTSGEKNWSFIKLGLAASGSHLNKVLITVPCF